MSRTLLVADDSATMRQVVTMAFKGSHYRVVAVGGGAEALQAAYQHKPDVILLDYHLPDRSGLDVCRALKGDPSLKHIPVLIMSGSYHPFDEREASESGSDDVIRKPFRTQTVREKVARLAEQPRENLVRSTPAAPAVTGTDATDAAIKPMPSVPVPPGPPRAAAAPARYPQPPAPLPSRTNPPEPIRTQAPPRPSAPRPAQPAASAPSGAVSGMDKEELRSLVRAEVQKAVREEMFAMVKSVLGDLFKEKMMPKLLTYGEERISTLVESRMAAMVDQELANARKGLPEDG